MWDGAKYRKMPGDNATTLHLSPLGSIGLYTSYRLWYVPPHDLCLPPLAVRLQRCYVALVSGLQRGGRSATAARPGHAPPPDAATAAASFAQKLWRFTSNTRVPYPALMTPLLQVVRNATAARPGRVHLVVHDWSTLAFGSHPSKRDRKRLTNDRDCGYDLHLALLVDAADGSAVAPVDVTLTTADAVLSTRPDGIADQPAGHVDQLLPAMTAVAALALPARLVHVIDREADSVGHWRQWDPTHRVLVRADDRQVLWNGQPAKLSTIHAAVRGKGEFRDGGAVKYRGTKAHLFVAETVVVLHRPAKTTVDGTSVAVPGRPLELRLVLTEVRDEDGKVLATWWLLTNAPADWGTSADVARWYYSRWRIESTFKLLKSAGWDVEEWRQRTGPGLLRKLLVALAGCVSVWRLQARDDASAEWLKELLMRLSGRQVKRSVPVTTAGLLAGLWVWQSASAVIGDTGQDTVERLIADHLPLFAAPPKPKKDV